MVQSRLNTLQRCKQFVNGLEALLGHSVKPKCVREGGTVWHVFEGADGKYVRKITPHVTNKEEGTCNHHLWNVQCEKDMWPADPDPKIQLKYSGCRKTENFDTGVFVAKETKGIATGTGQATTHTTTKFSAKGKSVSTTPLDRSACEFSATITETTSGNRTTVTQPPPDGEEPSQAVDYPAYTNTTTVKIDFPVIRRDTQLGAYQALIEEILLVHSVSALAVLGLLALLCIPQPKMERVQPPRSELGAEYVMEFGAVGSKRHGVTVGTTLRGGTPGECLLGLMPYFVHWGFGALTSPLILQELQPRMYLPGRPLQPPSIYQFFTDFDCSDMAAYRDPAISFVPSVNTEGRLVQQPCVLMPLRVPFVFPIHLGYYNPADPILMQFISDIGNHIFGASSPYLTNVDLDRFTVLRIPCALMDPFMEPFELLTEGAHAALGAAPGLVPEAPPFHVSRWAPAACGGFVGPINTEGLDKDARLLVSDGWWHVPTSIDFKVFPKKEMWGRINGRLILVFKVLGAGLVERQGRKVVVPMVTLEAINGQA